jgi:hypothetical protein
VSFQAYIDNIKTKTGFSPADFRTLAERKGLLTDGKLNATTKATMVTNWLKAEHDLGHGHAMAIYATFKGKTQESGNPRPSSGSQSDLAIIRDKTMAVQKFRTKILTGQSKNVTGIEVPPEVIIALAAGLRPRVKVQVDAYAYASTVGKMGDKFMISLSAEHREAAGLAGGQIVEVSLELDAEPAAFNVPVDLSAALLAAGLSERFEISAPSRRKEWLRQIEEAKAPETRSRRIRNVIGLLSGAAAGR